MTNRAVNNRLINHSLTTAFTRETRLLPTPTSSTEQAFPTAWPSAPPKEYHDTSE